VDVLKKDAEGNAIRDEASEEVREVLFEVDDIHKAILERNKKHFHQADKTPVAGGAENMVLYDLIGYTGMSQAAKDVVDDTFLAKYGDKLGNILPKTEQVIRELSMPEKIKVLGKKIKTEILEEDFLSGFKGWKESTSTSPSGRHVGRYKAIVNDPDLKKQDPEKSHLQEWETNFVSSLVKLLNLPIKYGFAPKRWCTSVTVMIEKDPGNPRIEGLCVIHLFVADYNLSLKLLWGKRMVYQGEDNNCFGKQQHGSRPLHQAINPVHLKTLNYDLTRILRTSLIMFDNDATGCFDRIIVSLAMIAALRLGMPCPAAQMHSSIVLHMKYFIKMAHGISDSFYCVLQDYLPYGTGQGSGASPSVWLSLVVILLTALAVLAPLAMSFVDPWEDIHEERNADSFVDDTSNGCNDAHLGEPMPYAELIATAQAGAQIWEQLLYSSGGALELKKCFWYLIYWQWVNDHPQMAMNLFCPGIIALTSGNIPNYQVIPRLELWEAQ
jgi:hypothetical protein